MEYLEFVFSSFWVFIGSLILISVILQFPFNMWNRFLRNLNIKRQGWPPPHLDADGDFRKKKEVSDD